MLYPFQVYQSKVEQHTFWVAKSSSLKGCVGQGETAEEAIAELEANEQDWLATAEAVGIPVPAVPVEAPQDYSGKLTVRIAPRVHMDAARIAKTEKISLTQYISDAIINWNAHNSPA
ncbi:MAG: toxin-antitoxin system HicB family antitoxin [Oscillospiraceae bacterium]|nr:toxin-antitoxin system HicB family antitoxin [Oscillospiraceae bacterium]